MALYDHETQKVVLRVVYDGPAGAGKTTNVRQLGGFFTLRRRSEITVPEEVDGRTLFFDFMQLDGGLVAGESLRCQILSVPGQRKLAARRKRILQTADVVVFVCSSAARSQAKARELLETLRWALRSAGREDVPVIVQANKQDLATALALERIRTALELDASVEIVGAMADKGVGVRETAVLAIRAGARVVEQVIRERGIDALEGRSETAQQLLARLRELGEVSLSADEIREEAEEEHEPEPSHATAAEPPTPAPQEQSAPAIPTASVHATATEPAPPLRVETQRPPSPNGDVPTGCVWPSATGRQVLQALHGEVWHRRAELSGQRGVHDGSGDAHALVYRVGTYCAKTSARRRFDSLDDGRAALLNLARRKIVLGDLLAPGTVLAVQEDAPRGAWLWTFAPWMPTLRGAMSSATEARDDVALAAVLGEFARAAIVAVELGLRRDLVLDVHPSNFGCVGKSLFYLDDDIGAGSTLPMLGHALLQRVEEHVHAESVVQRYVASVRDHAVRMLTPEQLRRAALIESLEGASVRSERAATARRDLVVALERHARGKEP